MVVRNLPQLDESQDYYSSGKTIDVAAVVTHEIINQRMLTNMLTNTQGYYNTWTEEVPDVSETDDDLTGTDVATTEDFISDISPGAGPNIEFGTSTGGLDFMSSSGYPQIEYVHPCAPLSSKIDV